MISDASKMTWQKIAEMGIYWQKANFPFNSLLKIPPPQVTPEKSPTKSELGQRP